ncbi:MAG: hypothetical protein U0103_13845 [Candidatus Obscuribacterales bacterium]
MNPQLHLVEQPYSRQQKRPALPADASRALQAASEGYDGAQPSAGFDAQHEAENAAAHLRLHQKRSRHRAPSRPETQVVA